MLTSTRRSISYPNTDRSDRPDIPAHILNLVTALELDVIYAQGTSAARLSAVHMAGVIWRETDTGLFYWDTGSTWVSFLANPRYVKTTVKDVNTTAAATDLFNGEITIGAGVLGTDKIAHIKVWGDYLNNTGADRQFTLGLKYGATYMWKTLNVSAIGASATRRAWLFEAELSAQGATNVQTLGGRFSISANVAATVAGTGNIDTAGTSSAHPQFATFYGTAAEDSTAAKALVLEVTHSTSSANLSMRLEGAVVTVS